MSDFTNVTAIKRANLYFDGKVSSRTIILENGEKKTLGIMMPGTYKFSTVEKELMEITAGSLDAKLPGEDNFVSLKEGDSFSIHSNSEFTVVVKEVVDYCCSYIK